MTLSLTFPDTTYSSDNKPSADTLKADLTAIEEAVNTNETAIAALDAEVTELSWTDWTPTNTNITVGNGTLVARYARVGNTIHYVWSLLLGSTSAIGSSPRFTLPTTPNKTSSHANSIELLGDVSINSGSVSFRGDAIALGGAETNLAYLNVFAAGSTYLQRTAVTATVPGTFATGWFIHVKGTYESN